MPDFPTRDVTARALAERILSGYLQQAAGATHPQQEQALLARLAEGLTSVQTVAAANDVLDAWEDADPGIRGPRVETIDLAGLTVTMARRSN